ncbi:unnamed protein product [Bemisia tabaci]|uniref:TRASH domain-containing protein n=1 Tax=Bemisia tabaci TaxID=7038 RepID=A0A9P0EZE7_BEMTA|nr:unnamed protein product [Bemisia tabaci]
MEEVADELRTKDHQNEASDKVNGSASQEADGSANSNNDLLSDNISTLKSKLSDLQNSADNVESNCSELDSIVEGSRENDNTSSEPILTPAVSDEVSKKVALEAEAKTVESDDITDALAEIEASKSEKEGVNMDSDHNMEVETDDNEVNTSKVCNDSLNPEVQDSNSVDMGSPVSNSSMQDEESEGPNDAELKNLAEEDSKISSNEIGSEDVAPCNIKSPSTNSNLSGEESLAKKSEGTIISNAENVADHTENSESADNLENADIVAPDSPGESTDRADFADPLSAAVENSAENVETDPSSKDGESEDLESIDDANSKRCSEDKTDKPVSHDDVDNQADTFEQDGHSNEPTESTSFLNMDQDSVPEDGEPDARSMQEHIEDPFSSGPEESAQTLKTAEEAKNSTEQQKATEETLDDKEINKEASETEKSSELVESSTVAEAAETSSSILQEVEKPVEAQEVEESSEVSEVEKGSENGSEEKEGSEKPLEEKGTTDLAEEAAESKELNGKQGDTAVIIDDGSETEEELDDTDKFGKITKIYSAASKTATTVGESKTLTSESKAIDKDSSKVGDKSEVSVAAGKVVQTIGKSVEAGALGSTEQSVKKKTVTELSIDVSQEEDEFSGPESPSIVDVTPEIMEIDDFGSSGTSVKSETTSTKEEKKGEQVSKSTDKSSGINLAEPEVVIDIDEEPSKLSGKLPGKRGRKKSSPAEPENICIVPDLPEIQTVRSLAPVKQKVGKGMKIAPPPELDTTPTGRTRRKAAETAGLKMKKIMADTQDDVATDPGEPMVSRENFVRKCAECKKRLVMSEATLFWETMEFCDEACLGSYLTKLGKYCANCKGDVQQASLGKYCVRFGTDINQFCRSQCLEEFKKGLKVCSYCQKDISSGPEGFLAPVGDKGQFKDFCTQQCMHLYETISNNLPEPTERQKCTVCNHDNVVKVKVRLNNKETKLCSEVCFAAFKFANSVECEKCDMCRKYYHNRKSHVIFYEDELHTFCSKTCMNVYILGKRRIILCNTCKVKKYNFDMIKRVLSNGTAVFACSLNCLANYQKSSPTSRSINCDHCGLSRPVQYNLNMSDGSLRSFCTLVCVMNFQAQSKASHHKVYPVGGPKKVSAKKSVSTGVDSVPVISTVTSLAQANGPKANSHTPKTGVIQQIVMRPPIPKPVCNKIIQCRPSHNTKGVSCKPFMTTKSTQTEEDKPQQVLLPIPVPIYVPLPCAMYKLPVPFAMPIPIPIPVPIFIPTTRNSAKGIMKQIKKIQKKIPQDPFEAELLMMAEMVAGEKKEDVTSSSDEDDDVGGDIGADVSLHNESEDDARALSSAGNQSPTVSVKSSISCKAPHLDDLADIEDTLKPSTIVPTERPPSEQSRDIDPPSPPIMKKAARKRTSTSGYGAESIGMKRIRRSQDGLDSPAPPSPPLEIIRPDANMNLKYTYGVNAWRQWIMMKNTELERSCAKTGRKPVLFKTDLLKLTPDELSYTLCLFLKEVKKPNGTEYAPDTLFYFCLGIQHYLYENGRVDNLFTDPFYEGFTDRLDEIGIKFSSMYDGTRQIVTRIEEEHLWESKQLGAHSPHVLLNTLMFFNTKHFNLATVDEHNQLSFAHIMKHWKRSGGAAVPATSKHQPAANRNVLLRFYPPQSSLDGNSRKKKMYEQKENEENPLRCPVKLYEFYLSKCPESVKTRNDVFYLLPERSCVPDSPVWYSTMALDKKSLVKMLNRIKMVKEVNIALLTM